MSDNATTNDPAVPPDPIYQKSYSVPIAVASILLVGSVALAIADEMFFRRGYKGIQRKHAEVMVPYLDSLLGSRVTVETARKSADEYAALSATLKASEEAAFPARIVAQDSFQNLDAEGAALSAAIKTPNSEIAALTYSIEHATHLGHDAEATELKAKIAEVLARNVKAGEFHWEKRERKAEFAGVLRFTAEDPETAPSANDTPEAAIGKQKLIGQMKKPTPDWYETTVVDVTGTVAELKARFATVVEAKGKLQTAIGQLVLPEAAARKARDRWLDENLRDISGFLDGDTTKDTPEAKEILAKLNEVGASVWLRDYSHNLDSSSLAAIRESFANKPKDPIRQGEIKQIFVRESNWLDRCATCHVGVDSVVPVTKDALTASLSKAGWSASKIDAYPLQLMTSHPRAAELFAHHDPETVGCSTCHNGNGVAITDTFSAHGENKHWLWPLHKPENYEAGCLQCHQGDMALAGGDRITAGRETFLEKGCWGCHPYKGHDPEPEAINALTSRINDMERTIDRKLQMADQVKGLSGSVENEKVREANAAAVVNEVQALRTEAGQLRTEQDKLRRELAMRWQERQRVGPNLKDVRAKLRPEILFDWVKDPSSVRLDSKMPAFRFENDEEVKDVVAFIWQSALTPQEFPEYQLSAPTGGDVGRGRGLFMTAGTKGCLSCHAIEDEESKLVVGNTRAANLTNLGDKDNYEYVYRWIKDPKHRLVAFDVRTGKDLTAADAAKADPADLVTAQPTIMPDFRLSDEDARDIAAYLVSRKSGKWTEKPTWLDDTSRFERGKKVVQYLGCAGCHEIRGLENEKGIGRELTTEGSQALDRLDFGHLTIGAQRGEEDPLAEWTTQKDGVRLFGDEKPWYRPRGFFMHKLAKPDVYDSAKHLPDRFTRLRMPQFRWAAQEIHDLTTFLLGSVQAVVPEKMRYQPNADQQAIREGWWVVKKHNCQGCHPFTPDAIPDLWTLPYFAEQVSKVTHDTVLPPTLVGAGFRMRPEFIADFLRDPSLGGGAANPISTRKHLAVRMPTFALSEDEIAKLVRFFVAMAKQSPVYQPEVVPTITAAEKKVAEAIWKEVNCATCHPPYVGGKPLVTADTKAPDLTYAARKLRPEWMRRWIRNPAGLIPRTQMAANFKESVAEHRWLRDGDFTKYPEIAAYKGDHVELMIRYLVNEYARDPSVK